MADTTSDATPAPKRRRLDGTDEAQPTTGPAGKYNDLWLEDGNIVLQCAEGAFRVHRSLLAAQSEVFRDMFSLATPATGADDAIPTVRLSDDTDHMYRFLRCLILHKYPPKESIEYMDALLDIYELSRKYIVPVMRDVCVEILKGLFPDGLEAYQVTIGNRLKVVSFRATLRCIVAATTDNLPTLLPACYLHIAAYYSGEMLDIKKAAAWPADIPLTVYATIVRSMRQLAHLKREVIEDFSENWADEWGVESHEHVISALLTYYCGPNNAGAFPEENLDLFNPDWTATDVVRYRGIEELCVECSLKWDTAQRSSWEIAWAKLPEYLLLDSWDKMREQEAHASSTA